jgi:hypothetical protein
MKVYGAGRAMEVEIKYQSVSNININEASCSLMTEARLMMASSGLLFQ